MPRRLKFQHRKKQEREKQTKRQTSNCTILPVNNPLEVQDVQSSESLLKQLHSSLKVPSRAWSDQSPDGLEKIILCKISQESGSSSQPLTVTHSLTVNSDLTWALFVNGHEVTPNICTALSSFPRMLQLETFPQLLDNTSLSVLGNQILNSLTC